MRRIFTATALLASVFVHAQLLLHWEHDQYPWNLANALPADITTDAAGSVYVCGEIDSVINTPNVRDGFLQKIDAYGNVMWTATYDTAAGWGKFNAVTVDASGNVYVTGQQLNPAISTIYRVMITASYDPSGNLRWTRYYNGTYGHGANGIDILIDQQGNVIVGGNVPTPSNTQSHGFFSYTTNGALNWVSLSAQLAANFGLISIGMDASGKIYGGSAMAVNSPWRNTVHAVCVDPAASGAVQWEQSWTVGALTPGYCVDSAGNSYWCGRDSLTTGGRIISMDPGGNQRWIAVYQSPWLPISTDLFDIGADAQGHVYAAGREAPVAGTSYGFVVAFDTAGQQQWVTRVDSNGVEQLEHIAVSPAGFIAASGLRSTISAQTCALQAKFNPSGTLAGWDTTLNVTALWSRSYGAAISDNGNYVYFTAQQMYPQFPQGGNHMSMVTNKYIKDILDDVMEPASPALAVYPNPSSGTLFVSSPFAEQVEMCITDAAGSVVHRQNVSPGISENTMALPPGLYLVRLGDGRETLTTKLIVR